MACSPRIVVLAGLLSTAWTVSPAFARGWDCHYQSSAGAQFVTHFVRDGQMLVEPHWPQPIVYRIVVDDDDILIAAHGYVDPPAFRQSARGGAVVVILNKATGRMRRSLGASGEATDRVDFGLCART